MVFLEPEVQALNLTSPRDFIKLIVEFFCRSDSSAISEVEQALIQDLLARAATDGLNYEQFNEILLLLSQNRVSRAFFEFFFGTGTIALEQLRQGVIQFRGFAMLCYGNFIFARRKLARKATVQEIAECLRPFGEDPSGRLAMLTGRPPRVLDIEPISRDETWFTGEITGRILQKEIALLAEELDVESESSDPALRAFGAKLLRMDEASKRVQRVALRNADVYLTWDYLDVYVATSMRNKREFEETYDFIQEVFGNEILKPLNLRYFDPTQCKCENPRDKGLVEGLMLSRAACTIYMAQESDTLGKDSELAATLAQGKPVIAYVPEREPDVSAYPLEFLKKRLLILDAEGVLDDPECERRLAEFDPDFESTINAYLRRFEEHRSIQPFTLDNALDEPFRGTCVEYQKTCALLAIAELYNFERRNHLFKGRHPLSMQVDLTSGVANGVLVVRTAEKCAKLLYGVLTNELRLEISREPDHNRFTVLQEEISESPFRVVTHNERLTNSFWNLFGGRRR